MDNLANRITNLSPEQLAKLTQHLQKKRQDSPSSIPVQSRDTDTFPLSFSQQRLWLLHQLQPESPFYHLPSSIRITGPLDIPILEKSLTTLCERHEPLRTVFKFDGDGEPVQVIQPAQPWVLERIDLQDVSQQQQQIDYHASAIAKDPFDLAKGPLLRSRLLQLDTNSYILCLCLHHIIADGWALGIIIRELTALYEAFQADRPNPLPPLSIQYIDYGMWQRDWLEGENSQRHIQYWQRQLEGAPTVLELPTDYPRSPVQTTQGGRQAVALTPKLTQSLKDLGKSEGATLFMTVLAAFNVLLYRYTEQTDLVVGAPVANRNQVATEQLIGVLINTLALRTQLEPDCSFRQLLQQVRDVVIEANAHQDLPFEKLVDVLQPERSRSYAPLLQVLLTVQNLPFQAYPCGDLTIHPEPIFTGTTQFDLVLNLGEFADGLTGWLEYNTDIFAADTIQRLVEHLTEILIHCATTPDCNISAMPLLTAQERQLMEDWNNTLAKYPQNQAAHQLFEAQAEKTPDAIALILGSERLSYRDLNIRANQLAYTLQQQGVGLETLVGVCVSRSMDMVIAVLAILKAGGAYVPLDPKYPTERLQFMLKDSQVGVLLTQTHLLESLPDTDAEIICLDKAFTDQPKRSPNPVDVTADNLAYVIYTSGSTGKPKGVLSTHGGLCNLTAVQQRCFKAGVGSRVLQFSSPSFDAS
ncbi:MAG: condensation domain-containing protein, partial [Cyanobacteria bacterium J06607_17]